MYIPLHCGTSLSKKCPERYLVTPSLYYSGVIVQVPKNCSIFLDRQQKENKSELKKSESEKKVRNEVKKNKQIK